MGKHSAGACPESRDRVRLAGGLLLGVAASGALATGSVSSAGVANATCASFSGMGNGGACTSTNIGDVVIGLGNTGPVIATVVSTPPSRSATTQRHLQLHPRRAVISTSLSPSATTLRRPRRAV